MRSPNLLIAAVLIFTLAGCGDMKYSAYETSIPSGSINLTTRNLSALSAVENEYINRISGISNNADLAPYKVVVLTDSHNDYDDLISVVDIINAQADIAFVLHIGDITNLGLKQEYLWFSDIMSRLNKPYLTIIGNHDALSYGKNIYTKMFGPFNYSFVFQNTKFLMLNTNNLNFPEGTYNPLWLEAELASATEYEHTIVLAHTPPFAPVTGYSNDEVSQGYALVKEYNVKMVLFGHMHSSIYLDTSTVKYIIVPRVQGLQYGMLTFNTNGVVFDVCTPGCSRVY